MVNSIRLYAALFLAMVFFSTALVSASDFSTTEHNATAQLTPQWSTPGDNIDYTFEITNDGPDKINQVWIYKNPEYDNFTCEPKTGWYVNYFNVNAPGGLGSTDSCLYVAQANSTSVFGDGDSANFYFSATTPESSFDQICDLKWYVQTTDNNENDSGVWKLNHDTTIIDEVPPTIDLSVGDPNVTHDDGELYIKPNETNITVDVSDDGELECSSGIDYCEWRYYLNGEVSDWTEVDGNGQTNLQFNVTFPENSDHELEVQCFDRAGNEANISDDYRVDGDAPVTDLVVNGPFHEEGEINYLNGVSNISLTAEDNKFDSCGVLLFYELYKDGDKIQNLTGNYGDECDGEVIVGPFDEGNYSMKYKSMDFLKNKEEYRWFNFTVDKTPPVMDKTISEPKVPFCDLSDVSDFSLNQDDMAQNNQDNLVFDIDVVRELDCEYATWTFDFVDYSSGWDNQIQLIIADENDVPMFHVASPKESGDDWYIKEFDGGWGSELSLPSDILVTGTHNSGVYEIKIPISYLDNDGFRWAVNTEASFPSQSGSAQQYFPVDWTRWSASAPHNHFKDVFFEDWYVNSSTDISLSCVDDVSGLDSIYYRYGNRNSSEDDFDWYSDGDDGWVSSSDDVSFNFPQTSEHMLEWYCVDNVNKTSDVDVEYFRVDNEAPIINKTVVGEDQLGDCPPEPNSDEDCFISNETVVQFNAFDVDSIHASNDVMCDYEVEWNDEIVDSGSWSEGDDVVEIEFENDSEHTVTITCEDGIGNKVVDVENFKVDMTPPNTTKMYGEPMVWDDDHRWITSDTLINLSAFDEKVGVEEIRWRYGWVSNDTCEAYIDNPCPVGLASSQEVCSEEDQLSGECHNQCEEVLGLDVEFNVTEGNFTEFSIPRTSCHMIEYFAVDKFNNTEELQRQFVMVDNEAPVGNKTVGLPSMFVEGQPSTEFFEEWDFDYHRYVSQDTPITLTCEDVNPHPVGDEELKFKVFNNDSDVTEEYCVEEGDMTEDGYCVVDDESYDFYFKEDSEHVLEYYCADGLGNSDGENVQFYFVDTMAPVTTHDILGPMFVDENGSTYIDTATTINLSAFDPEPHPSGLNNTYYAWQLVDDAYCEGESDGTPELQDVMLGEFDWSEEDNEPYWKWPNGTKVLVSDMSASMAKGFDSHRTYEFAIPLSELDLSEGDLLKLGVYTVDGVHKSKQRIANHRPSSNQPSFPWSDTSDWVPYQLVDDGLNITVDGDLSDWSSDAYIFTESDAYNQSSGSNVDHEFDFYATVSDGHLVVGIDYEDDVTDDIHPTKGDNKDGAKVMLAASPWREYSESFQIDEESCHVVKYKSVDNLGNEEDLNEMFVFVDKSAPVINKTYMGGYYEEIINDSLVKWITTSTDVVVDVYDPEPHPSGLDYSEYRVSLVDDALCWDQSNAVEVEGEGSWNMFEDASSHVFNVPEESCHLIEIRSVDNVNKSDWHKQLVFVDDTAPSTAKVIGNPNSVMSEGDIERGYEYFNEDAGFNPALTQEFCAEGDQNCMEVTLLTSINLACEDPEPHPSEGEAVYFKVHWDGDDVTGEYCSDAEGNMTEDGYCYLEEGANSFHFMKESWHRLEYYCEDNVGNVGESDVEYFKVEGTAFDIELNKKWNLISVPVKLLDDSMDEVFGDQEGVVSVWTYNGTDWSVWSPNGPSDLNTMYPGWGYWVLTTQDSTLTIGGSLLSPTVTPPSRPIVNGWNLIGYYGSDEAPMNNSVPYYDGPNLGADGKSAYCALSSLVSDVDDVPFPSLWTYWEDDNPNQWVELDAGAGDFMNPGAGYWLLYSKSAGAVYGPSTSCSFVGGLLN